MDNTIAESETTTVNSLNFGLPETAQYITDRRHVKFFHQAVMFLIQMQETIIIDFIYQEKTTHILIYQVFVYLQIFKTLTEHEAIFYDR